MKPGCDGMMPYSRNAAVVHNSRVLIYSIGSGYNLAAMTEEYDDKSSKCIIRLGLDAAIDLPLEVKPSFYAPVLNNQSLNEGISYLCEIDPDLSKIVSNLGKPPLWSREPDFPTLIHIILEQQVSLASAKAAFKKLETAAVMLTPKKFIKFSDLELREFGFSRQKARYGRVLSQAMITGALDLEGLPYLDDNAARSALMKIKGVGPWTADIYLLMALLRPDIWPSGDLALAKAVQKIKHLSERPGLGKLSAIAEQWKPYRAVAARILWHDYLNDQ